MEVVTNSPKAAIREAFKQGVIDYDKYWLKIVNMRNEISHIYNEETADNIYSELPKIFDYLKLLETKTE